MFLFQQIPLDYLVRSVVDYRRRRIVKAFAFVFEQSDISERTHAPVRTPYCRPENNSFSNSFWFFNYYRIVLFRFYFWTDYTNVSFIYIYLLLLYCFFCFIAATDQFGRERDDERADVHAGDQRLGQDAELPRRDRQTGKRQPQTRQARWPAAPSRRRRFVRRVENEHFPWVAIVFARISVVFCFFILARARVSVEEEEKKMNAKGARRSYCTENISFRVRFRDRVSKRDVLRVPPVTRAGFSIVRQSIVVVGNVTILRVFRSQRIGKRIVLFSVQINPVPTRLAIVRSTTCNSEWRIHSYTLRVTKYLSLFLYRFWRYSFFNSLHLSIRWLL